MVLDRIGRKGGRYRLPQAFMAMFGRADGRPSRILRSRHARAQTVQPSEPFAIVVPTRDMQGHHREHAGIDRRARRDVGKRRDVHPTPEGPFGLVAQTRDGPRFAWATMKRSKGSANLCVALKSNRERSVETGEGV